MKKIISFVLVLVCAFTLFSCGGGDSTEKAIKEINDMYNAISPFLVTTETTQSFGKYTLTGKSTLKIGTVDGFAVTVYEYENQRLRDIESGAGEEIVDPIETVKGSMEFHEELGYRENGGKWDEYGDDFTPPSGANALTLTKETVEDFTIDEENKTYKFKVLAANTEAVFGTAIDSDVEVTIMHSGADIIGVELSYVEKSDNDDHPEIQTTVKATYSYESQTITLN